MIVVIMGFIGAFLSLVIARSDATVVQDQMEQTRCLADSALALKLDEIRRAEYGDMSGACSMGTYGCTVRHLGGDRYLLVATATVRGYTRRIEVVVNRSVTPLHGFVRGAVTANGPVSTLGDITIDGRNYDDGGSFVVDNGTNGISTTNQVSVGGSSSVGGNGNAPIGGAGDGDGVYEEDAPWADGVDNDGDGATDEEAFNGKDDDGDGLIDEDLGPYPPSPDVYFGLTDGQMKGAAQAEGTYFTNSTDFNNWVLANGGDVPGGKIIYLDYDLQVPMEFGPNLNEKPSIIIQHNDTGDAHMKNLHGAFKGIILSDVITHINGECYIVGGIASFAQENLGNAYGNGDAMVLYSTEVLSNLPSILQAGAGYTVLSWREVAQ
jgi:hypothetical protein